MQPEGENNSYLMLFLEVILSTRAEHIASRALILFGSCLRFSQVSCNISSSNSINLSCSAHLISHRLMSYCASLCWIA